MRPSRRLFAAVARTIKYLEPNVPTGLTGVSTHPSPRPALLYTYSVTLERLKQLPTSSVYRQSTEALTKHRLNIVESVKPPGHTEWLARVQKEIDSNPDAYKRYRREDGRIVAEEYMDEDRSDVWDGETTKSQRQNTMNSSEGEASRRAQRVKDEIEKVEAEDDKGPDLSLQTLEDEPRLTAEQVDELEHKIAAGLIEEVLAVAEGELKLIDEMIASRAYEDLEEKAPPGQWEYFDRGDRV